MNRITLGPSMSALALALLLATPCLAQTPLGTAFTHQGRLTDAGSPTTGSFDFQFLLFDAAGAGTQVGATIDRPGVAVNAGLFTISLDFGAIPFAGDARWLETHVRPAGGGAYTTLAPRQPLTAAPYALLAAQVVDGPGSGLDADLFDSLNSTQLLRSDASGVLAGTLAVNSAAGADALLSETGIDRSLAGSTTFTLQNSDPGAASTMQLQVESGTAPGAPAYSFVGDADTGMFRSNTDTIAFAAAGTQVMSLGTFGLSVVKTTPGGAAVTGTGPGSVLGDGVWGYTGSGGRGVVAQNTSTGIGLLAASAAGDHVLAATSLGTPVDPVLRITNGGSVLSEGTLAMGNAVTTSTSALGFNSFGNPANKDESVISAANDVYVEGGLEVDGFIFGQGLRVGPANEVILNSGSMDVPDGFTINVGVGADASSNLTIAGTNAIFRIGDSPSDKVGIVRTPVVNSLEVEGAASKTTAGSWLANSDRRLKTDIEGLEDALGVVRRLRPVRFRYNEEFQEKHPSVRDVYYHNYIAQEFQDVFPDSVQDDGEGYLQIDTHPADVYAVGAIQELDRLLSEKDSRIEALEERVARLEDMLATRLAQLEKALRP